MPWVTNEASASASSSSAVQPPGPAGHSPVGPSGEDGGARPSSQAVIPKPRIGKAFDWNKLHNASEEDLEDYIYAYRYQLLAGILILHLIPPLVLLCMGKSENISVMVVWGIVPLGFPVLVGLGWACPNLMQICETYHWFEGEEWQTLCAWCNGLVTIFLLLFLVIAGKFRYPATALVVFIDLIFFCFCTAKICAGFKERHPSSLEGTARVTPILEPVVDGVVLGQKSIVAGELILAHHQPQPQLAIGREGGEEGREALGDPSGAGDPPSLSGPPPQMRIQEGP